MFDTLLHERVTQYFMCNGLLSGNQFGFRQDRNTELTTLHLIDKNFQHLRRVRTVYVFLILVHVLTPFLGRFCSLSYIELNIIKSYFNNRSQFVTYDGVVSTILSQNIGAVHGSKLGPKFFDIFTNYMNSLFENDENVMYADIRRGGPVSVGETCKQRLSKVLRLVSI